TGNDRHERLDRLHMRGDDPLNNTQVTRPPHADHAIEPGLLGHPIDSDLSVVALREVWIEYALRVETAPRVLDDDMITALAKRCPKNASSKPNPPDSVFRPYGERIRMVGTLPDDTG